MKKKWFSLCAKAICIATAFLFIGFSNIEVNAYTGETGYQVVVPSEKYPDRYVLIDKPVDDYILNGGFYELNGQVVFLMDNMLQTVTLIDEFYAGVDGSLTPYNAETKPAIDAEVNALLQVKLAEAKNRYGIEFKFRPIYNSFENYHYVDELMKLIDYSFPDGSIQIIAKASEANTGKNLNFQQINDEINAVAILGMNGLTGTYSWKTNRITTYINEALIGHELGHAIENTLNAASGGQLRTNFKAINGEYDYSKYYYYSGNDEIYNSFYDGIWEYVSREYAATSYAEDFADTFSDALCFSTDELAVMAGNGSIGMPYFQKVLYVKQLFNQYAGGMILP